MREAADISSVFVEDLGLRDPHMASIDQVITQPPHALDFGDEFSAAVDEAAKDWSRAALAAIREQHTDRSAS